MAGIGIDVAASTGAQLIATAPTVLAAAVYTGAVIASSLVIVGTVTVGSAFAALRAVAVVELSPQLSGQLDLWLLIKSLKLYNQSTKNANFHEFHHICIKIAFQSN